MYNVLLIFFSSVLYCIALYNIVLYYILYNCIIIVVITVLDRNVTVTIIMKNNEQ